MHKYPKESLKKIAVLFTDIVGSTAYFKSHGNRAGREMLQAHQDLASKPIFEHNGVLVKTLGDSVMAYFVDPREAVKSAVKIQHKFREYNEEKTNEEQIHIRVGLHFGEGIIEEKDIFGDVVNMAAKVVQMTENDQIYISQELYDVVKDLSHGIFQLVDTSNKRKVFKGFVIYKVLWHQKAALALIMDMLLYMEPLLDLNKVNIKEAWNSLITSKEKLWGDYIKKESIIPDKSIALIVKDASLSITVAKNILAFLKKKLGMNFEHFPLPIKIIIDFGSYLGAGKLTLEGMEVNWDEIDPGDVYITASAYKFIEDKQCFSVIPPSEAEQPQLFYKIILDEGHTRNKSTLFIYQKALVQGENPPCYYCGDRRHISSQCPSKQLTEITGSLKKLGYLSIGKINKLFYHYLFGEDMDPEAWSETENSPDSLKLLAYHGFYELKTVYQHRFFKAVWDSTTENWEKLKINKIQGLRGGPVWLGQDSIRISDLSQAEKLLKVYLEKTPTDYKAYCSMGFLKMEEDNFSEARVCLDKALGYAKTRPQKILLFFLLSRLY
ncbi:MAG TPA: adenylate/guanylate cyclase domain-containing protein, partial [Desulfatiglandales bacterium]|nr:adenylate/guanylate cyclase domain-containing protein [Desulfatiglandales bacterium]